MRVPHIAEIGAGAQQVPPVKRADHLFKKGGARRDSFTIGLPPVGQRRQHGRYRHLGHARRADLDIVDDLGQFQNEIGAGRYRAKAVPRHAVGF